MNKVILCLGSKCGNVMNNELGVEREIKALGDKTFYYNSDAGK